MTRPPDAAMRSYFPTRLARTRTKIHKSTCPNLAKATSAVQWNWAETHHDDDEWLVLSWLVPCQRCLYDLVVRQDEMARNGTLITDEEAWLNAHA